jgi:hypothetical protein
VFVDLKDGEVTCVMYLVSEQSYIYRIYYKQYGLDACVFTLLGLWFVRPNATP